MANFRIFRIFVVGWNAVLTKYFYLSVFPVDESVGICMRRTVLVAVEVLRRKQLHGLEKGDVFPARTRSYRMLQGELDHLQHCRPPGTLAQESKSRLLQSLLTLHIVRGVRDVCRSVLNVVQVFYVCECNALRIAFSHRQKNVFM